MRNKIIAVNAVIVLIVGLLSWVLMRQTISAAAGNPGVLLADAKHEVQGASARLQLDAMRSERWLAQRSTDPAALDAFQKSMDSARKEAATSFCDRVLSDARGAATFEGVAPAIAMLIDENGKMVGRNGSSLNSGRDLGADYASFKEALSKGRSGSDVWANKDRQDSFLASYAPVRTSDGRIAGMIAIGVGLADELSRVSDQTTGRALAIVAPQGAEVATVAHSTNTGALGDAVTGTAKDLSKRVLDGGKADAVPAGDIFVGASPLDGLGDGKHAALVSAAPITMIDNASAIPTPILYVMILGFILVVFGGWMLGNYITRPINLLEEGLLAILNGQQDKRFELDHAELGGLAFRIDQLLNQLMGIEEDTTDEQGRPSKAPSAADFREAMSVDRSAQGAEGQQVDPAQAQQLAAEPAPQYYARIYREYINAKKALGEQTDHITEQAFATRIQGMERDASQKYGRPVRYQVHARNKEVVLLAVPLPG